MPLCVALTSPQPLQPVLAESALGLKRKKYLMSGLSASARGRFVCAPLKTWKGFTGKDGDVAAGRNLKIHVRCGTDDAPQLVTMWVADEDVDRALHAVRDLSFGDDVEFIVQPGTKNHRFIDRLVLADAK